jgi:hypothetical protein
MKDEIGLADLIFQVKSELLARHPVEDAKGWPALFWIDQIELELSVSVTREGGGRIKLALIPIEAEVSGSRQEERGNTVKVRIAPLLDRREMYDLLAQDPDFVKVLERFSRSLTRDAGVQV